MLVFAKARLVFLSVPKTGTTAYQAALAPKADLVVRSPPELKHAPVFRYNRFFRPALEKFCGAGFDVLAVIREPIDWLGSWYRYRRRPGMEAAQNATHEISFDEFALAYMQGKRPPFAEVGSQAKFVEPCNNGTMATHLFRYEDQDGLRAFLGDRLGDVFETRRLNESPPGTPTLSPGVEKRLRRKCAHEFALWEGIGAAGSYTPIEVWDPSKA
jgi:hypothetical protein